MHRRREAGLAALPGATLASEADAAVKRRFALLGAGTVLGTGMAYGAIRLAGTRPRNAAFAAAAVVAGGLAILFIGSTIEQKLQAKTERQRIAAEGTAPP